MSHMVLSVQMLRSVLHGLSWIHFVVFPCISPGMVGWTKKPDSASISSILFWSIASWTFLWMRLLLCCRFGKWASCKCRCERRSPWHWCSLLAHCTCSQILLPGAKKVLIRITASPLSPLSGSLSSGTIVGVSTRPSAFTHSSTGLSSNARFLYCAPVCLHREPLLLVGFPHCWVALLERHTPGHMGLRHQEVEATERITARAVQ